jgi:hypothetical protein
MRRIKQKFSMDKALGHLTIVFALYALGAFNVKEVRAQAGCLTQCGGFGCECPPDPIPPKLSAQCFIEYREELLECPCGGANCSFDGPPTYQQHVESCERVCPSTLRTPCGASRSAPDYVWDDLGKQDCPCGAQRCKAEVWDSEYNGFTWTWNRVTRKGCPDPCKNAIKQPCQVVIGGHSDTKCFCGSGVPCHDENYQEIIVLPDGTPRTIPRPATCDRACRNGVAKCDTIPNRLPPSSVPQGMPYPFTSIEGRCCKEPKTYLHWQDCNGGTDCWRYSKKAYSEGCGGNDNCADKLYAHMHAPLPFLTSSWAACLLGADAGYPCDTNPTCLWYYAEGYWEQTWGATGGCHPAGPAAWQGSAPPNLETDSPGGPTGDCTTQLAVNTNNSCWFLMHGNCYCSP